MRIAWFDCIRINVEKSARGAQMVWSPFWMQIIELYCLNCYHLMIVCTCACAIRDRSGIAWNTCCFCYIDGGHLKTLGFIAYLKNPKKHTEKNIEHISIVAGFCCYFVKCRVSARAHPPIHWLLHQQWSVSVDFITMRKCKSWMQTTTQRKKIVQNKSNSPWNQRVQDATITITEKSQ